MNVTRDVITDLLPAYLAGDASADTRALVEEFLRADSALAADVRAHAEKSAVLLNTLSAAPPELASQELATFEKIRAYNRWSNQFFAFGLAFTLMPLAFGFDHGRITWIMLRDNPKQAVIFLAAAAYCWISRAVLRRRAAGPHAG